MSTDMCIPPLSTHLNDQHSQHLYAFDLHHHQHMIMENTNQQRQTTTINSSNIVSNNLNEDEHCQICGDLASGWHCG
jgi:hypothetical protein